METSVYTIVGDRDAVTVSKSVVEGVVSYGIQHPCFATPTNPDGTYVNNDLELVGDYARKIAQEGSAFA